MYWLKRADNGPFMGVEPQAQAELDLHLYSSTSAAATAHKSDKHLSPRKISIPPSPYRPQLPSRQSPRPHNTSPAGARKNSPSPTALRATGSSPMGSRVAAHSPSFRYNPVQSIPPLTRPVAVNQPYGSSWSNHSSAATGSSEAPLDLTKVRTTATPIPQPRKNSIADLAMPDKNSLTEVCYVCGQEIAKGLLFPVFARPNENYPFFPTLQLHPRPPKSRPMDVQGRVSACQSCQNHLLGQWQFYQSRNVPLEQRNYVITKKNVDVAKYSTFICYTCGLEYPVSSVRLLYTKDNLQGEPFYPDIEKSTPPPGASPVSASGTVQVCSICVKAIPQKQRFGVATSVRGPRSFQSIDSTDTSHGKRTVDSIETCSKQDSEATKRARFNVDDESSQLSGDIDSGLVNCHMCGQVNKKEVLKTVETNSHKGLLSRFQFLQQIVDKAEGSITTLFLCNSCHIYLMSEQQTPESKNDKPSTSATAISLANAVKSENLNLGKTEVRNENIEKSSDDKEENKPKIEPNGKKEEEGEKEGFLGINFGVTGCASCGYSSDDVPTDFFVKVTKDEKDSAAPHFPHLACKTTTDKAKVCIFCYHSMMLQWTLHQQTNSSEDYDVNNYICYVCGIQTYRKRVRALSKAVSLLFYIRNE